MIVTAPTALKEPGKLGLPSDFATDRQPDSALQMTANSQWDVLPAHFRFEGSLKQSDNSPFRRDFLFSIRLNHLHISFLLQRLPLRRLAEPDVTIIAVARQILHLVVEAILLREELTNSGTGLDWKVHAQIALLDRF